MRVRLTQFCVMLLFLMVPLAFNSCADDQQGAQEAVNAEQGEEGDESEYDDEEEYQEEGDEESADGQEEGEEGENYADEEGEDEYGENYADEEGEEGAEEELVEDDGSNAMENDELVNDSLAETLQENPQALDGNALANDANMAMQEAPQPNVTESMEGVEGNVAMAAEGSADMTPTPAALPEWGSKMAYIVKRGDTLGDIAGRVYGDRAKWREMAELSSLVNPNLIYIGDVVYYQLTQETAAFATAYESLPRQEVTVAEGDTLSSIASRVLDSSENWRHIWRQNDTVNDPNNLTAGTVLYYIAPGALSVSVAKDVNVKLAKVESIELDVQDVEVTIEMANEQPEAQQSDSVAGDISLISFI